MSTTHPLDPLISEFATQEEADSYDAWYCAQVQAAMDDDSPGIPHDEVMRRMWETIQQAGQKVA